MSSYEYIDEDGDKLTLEQGKRYVTVTARGLLDTKAIFVANADAPTVAAELLKAAGQESVIVPKSAERVEPDEDYITCGSGPEKAYGDLSQNPNWLWNCAANYIALAEYIENKAQRETEAAKKLQERRDAALQEMGIHDKYESLGLNAPMRKAIDRIIELEDGK